ncbi:MAG: transglycosylase SLT domain-containing protein [Deltaproteobacteria bacterium]|nr:transglycosylase SLT domain-containing protein [Deltaproteobacteria bacterium]
MMKKVLLLFIFALLPVYLSAQSFEDYVKGKEKGFAEKEKKSNEELKIKELAFKSAIDLNEKEFDQFVKKAEERWGEYTQSNVEEWVTYSGDADVVSIANLSNKGKYPGSIITKALIDIPEEMLINEELTPENEIRFREMAFHKISGQLTQVIGDEDSQTKNVTFSGQIQLAPERISTDHQEVIKILPNYVRENIKTVRTLRKRGNGGYQREYQIKVDLVPDHIEKRAMVYLETARSHARKNNIPVSLILAVMQTESFFNPYACSRPRNNTCLAYGLMQLVPKSGAREAYRYLYDKDKVVSGSYLFNQENNIKLGSAYLGKMINKDLRRVDSPENRYVLAISSYNTGHGNTAKGLMKIMDQSSRYPKPTLEVIARESNLLETQELIERLKTYLPYQETRHYLDKVTRRQAAFKTINE